MGDFEAMTEEELQTLKAMLNSKFKQEKQWITQKGREKSRFKNLPEKSRFKATTH